MKSAVLLWWVSVLVWLWEVRSRSQIKHGDIMVEVCCVRVCVCFVASFGSVDRQKCAGKRARRSDGEKRPLAFAFVEKKNNCVGTGAFVDVQRL